MFGRLRKSSPPSPADVAQVVAWERSSLEEYIAGMAQAGDNEPLFQGVSAFLEAGSTEAALAVLEHHPELMTSRGAAAFDSLVGFAELCGFVFLLPALRNRQAWLEELREAGWGQARGE